MNLIIDVGNTRVKLAVFSGEKLIKKSNVELMKLNSEIDLLIDSYPGIQKAIVSSVGGLKPSQLKSIRKKIDLTVLDHNTKVPFKNAYSTPKTLGVDRIALVSASAIKYPNKNVLIIDAGTCVTYDFIDSTNTYHGGAISPGIRLRYHALHNLTAKLPLLESRMPQNITGKSTSTSIHSGVINGLIFEIDGAIDEYERKYQHLTVILTGGDAKRLSKRLKNSIFANSNFLLEGLNYILEFNTSE